MAEKDKPQTAEDLPPADYAFWDIPGESLRVVYSLPLFHEIDFVVNEGYRKIPHGGIETAGLLFGSASQSEIRLEAFRPIECEHVSGPSLNFSERDLSLLEAQFLSAGQDSSLENFQPVGWFLGHTRGPLELSESEARHFDRFFPEPFKATVLVKPERFQPTRFSFLVRRASGEMPRDGLASAVILPLPGRSFKPGQLVSSIPAPNPIAVKPGGGKQRVLPDAEEPPPSERAAARPPSSEQPSRRDRKARSRMPPPGQEPAASNLGGHRPEEHGQPKEPGKDELRLDSIWKIPPDRETDEVPAITEQTPVPPAQRDQRRKLARERARLIEEAYPHPKTHSQETGSELTAFRPAALPSLPVDVVRYIPSAYDRVPAAEVEEEPPPASKLTAHSFTALALAALLGCLVGYIAYLQLPAPVIPIDVRPVDQTIVVSWPPDETRNAVYAAIRLNDGAPQPLSAQEKKTGHVSLSAMRDFKVEIVARNWIRDSRGIVRYLHSNNGNGVATPVDAPPSP